MKRAGQVVRSFWFAKKWGLNRYWVKRVFSGVWRPPRGRAKETPNTTAPNPVREQVVLAKCYPTVA